MFYSERKHILIKKIRKGVKTSTKVHEASKFMHFKTELDFIITLFQG